MSGKLCRTGGAFPTNLFLVANYRSPGGEKVSIFYDSIIGTRRLRLVGGKWETWWSENYTNHHNHILVLLSSTCMKVSRAYLSLEMET